MLWLGVLGREAQVQADLRTRNMRHLCIVGMAFTTPQH